MAKRKSSSLPSRKKKDDLKRASMALDDFVWAIQHVNIDQLKRAAEVLRFSLEADARSFSQAVGVGVKDRNKRYLIGVLPRLFQDREIFPQNEDIVDFAASALRLEMSRTEKRSRYEIIGKVVCETDSLDEAELSMLVHALDALMSDQEKLAKMAKRRRSAGFSWNETLQEMLNN